jgi:hypothetical protein
MSDGIRLGNGHDRNVVKDSTVDSNSPTNNDNPAGLKRRPVANADWNELVEDGTDDGNCPTNVQLALFAPNELDGRTFGPDEITIKIAGKLPGIHRPLRLEQHALVLVYARVTSVAPKIIEATANTGEHFEVTVTLSAKRGYLLTDEVADRLGTSVADLLEVAREVADEERDKADQAAGGYTGSLLRNGGSKP